MDTEVLEVAILPVIPGEEAAFEASFEQAQRIIAGMAGYLGHDLQRCIEQPNQYILLVRWRTLEDHTSGFRESAAYQQWKALLHHFYDPFPSVQHYTATGKGSDYGTT